MDGDYSEGTLLYLCSRDLLKLNPPEFSHSRGTSNGEVRGQRENRRDVVSSDRYHSII